jgi:archaellum component FlaC
MQSKKADLYEQIKKIAQEARCGNYGQVASDINIFLQLLQCELSKGYICTDDLSKVTYSLETLMEMQKKGDWIALADILEYEFTEIIGAW